MSCLIVGQRARLSGVIRPSDKRFSSGHQGMLRPVFLGTRGRSATDDFDVLTVPLGPVRPFAAPTRSFATSEPLFHAGLKVAHWSGQSAEKQRFNGLRTFLELQQPS
jgi:hypothetical protein